MSWTITLDVDGRGVARLVLNRPEKHNALSGGMCDEIARGGGATSRPMRRSGRWC